MAKTLPAKRAHRFSVYEGWGLEDFMDLANWSRQRSAIGGSSSAGYMDR